MATALGLDPAFNLSEEPLLSQLLEKINGVHELLTVQRHVNIGSQVLFGLEMLLSVFHAVTLCCLSECSVFVSFNDEDSLL